MTYLDWLAAALYLAVAGIALGEQLRAAEIVDPVFQAKAYTYKIPEGWGFRGAIVAGSSCIEGPSPVFRVASPDGITEMKMLPRFDWTWWDHPIPPGRPGDDCLALEKEIRADGFLRVMAGVLGVTIVREDPLPNHTELQEKMRQQKTGPRFDNARFVVRYTVKGTPVEEDLTVRMMCMSTTRYTSQGSYPFHTCSAWVLRARTREGQLMDLRSTFADIDRSVVIDQQWYKSWKSAGSGSEARSRMVRDAEAVRQRQYADFLTGLQGKGITTRSGDWADFVLHFSSTTTPSNG